MSGKRGPGRPRKNPLAEPKKKTGRHPGGRPSKFKKEYCLAVEYMARTGMTEQEIADRIGVAMSTISLWKVEHKEFSDALKRGKEEPDDEVERSLYARATGYSFESEKIITVSDGNLRGAHVERIPIIEHCPPDVTAQIFWLKNRRPKDWRDRHELTGADGDALVFSVSFVEPNAEHKDQ